MTTASLPQKYCIATISCDRFCVGTEVLLWSLLKYNPWFAGDINIVIADLSEESRERLRAIYPVNFVPAGDRLARKTEELASRIARLRDLRLRFYSLEAFNMTGYQRVVYFDSDTYCAGDVKNLFTGEHVLAACLDGFSYEQRALPLLDQAGLSLPITESRYGKTFTESFNAGVLAISAPALSERNYEALVAMLDYDTWVELGSSSFTDQVILNRHFEGQFTTLSSRYNYMVFLEEYLKHIDGVGFHDAAVVHFAGRIKPWNDYLTGEILEKAPHYLKYIEIWRELHADLRNKDDAGYRARKILDQYAWTEDAADLELAVQGRIY